MPRNRQAQLDTEALYRDEGCAAHPSCLSCPETVCLEERRSFPWRRAQRAAQTAEILQLAAAGLNDSQIGARLGIPRTTVIWLRTHGKGEGELTMVTAPQPRRCDRCRGTTQRVTTLDGPADKCVACGHETPVRALQPIEGQAQVRPSSAGAGSGAAVALVHVATDAWVQEAIAALREDLRTVAQIEVVRARAERTWRALTAYGADGVPELPWRAKGTPKRTEPATAAGGGGGTVLPRETNVTRRTCARCGRSAPPQAFVQTEGGGYVCRKQAECAARARNRED